MTTISSSAFGSFRTALGAMAAGALVLSTLACGQAVPANRVATAPSVTIAAAPVSCAGGTIRSDQGLASLAGCTEILGDLRIRNTNVTTLVKLSSLRTVLGKLDISDNRHLRSLSGLENLTKVGRVSLRNNPRLASIDALSDLRDVKGIVIEGAPSLRDCAGFDRIAALETLAIEDTGMRRLDGLSRLARVRHLSLLDNPELVSAAGLRRVENAEFIDIRGNRLLYGGADEFLPRLIWATEVVLTDNASMTRTDIDGLRRRVAIAPAPAAGKRAAR